MVPSLPITSLPNVHTLSDCANYTLTFHPFLPQLSNLFVFPVVDLDSLLQVYLQTNPAISGLAFCLSLFPIILCLSEYTKNYGQVDRLWSILPSVYNIHYVVWARLNHLPIGRLLYMLVFSTAWSVRLTFNFWRKGGFAVGHEDYRWESVKKEFSPRGFFFVNVLFISLFQSVLLYAITTPTYVILLSSLIQPAVTKADFVFTAGLLLLIAVETVADQQQWDYHTAKRQYQASAKLHVPLGWTRKQMERGFNTTGMWKYSRHPNFAIEQAVWIVFYAWGCHSSRSLYNWTLAGLLPLLGIFASSTRLTEMISAERYPEYELYQQQVGRLVPRWSFAKGPGWEELS